MDIILWTIGAALAVAVGVGLLALAWIWAVEKLVDALGFTRIIMQWYGEKLTKERDARQVPE